MYALYFKNLIKAISQKVQILNEKKHVIAV